MRRKFLHNYADALVRFSFRPHTQNEKKKKTEKENLILIPEIQTQISSGCGWMVSGFGSLGLGQATVMKQLQTISQQPR